MFKSNVFTKNAICPNFYGTASGMICKATNCYLKDMTDVDVHMCRNGRYEGCFYYRFSLIHVFIKNKMETSTSATV